MARAAPPFASLLLFALSVNASGTRRAGQVLDALSGCWDQCSSSSGGGNCKWFQPSCICNLANNSPYLASTVTCARQTCSDFSSTDVDRFISPIEFTCSLAGGIDQSRVSAAQAAASAPLSTASSAAPKPSSAPAPAPSPSPSPAQSAAPSPKSSPEPSPSPTRAPTPTTVETTLSVTTTDSEGSSAVIGQPLSIGPSGVSSGKRTTSVIKSTSNGGSSISEQSTTTNGIVMATGTPMPIDTNAPTSTSTSTKSHSTSAPGGGGTLFDSQGGAAGLVADRSLGLLYAAGMAAFALTVAL